MVIFKQSLATLMKPFNILHITLLLSTSLFSQGDINLYPQSSIYIERDYFTLSYSEDNEQAKWVYYKLDKKILNGQAQRKNNFKEDPKVITGSAKLSDYKGSGFDRGHLCPAGSMKISQQAMDDTFYMSNMSPQQPSFNRGIWKKLEGLIRDWVYKYGDLIVVTGPIFDEKMSSIGNSEVSVPNYFYKVIYALEDKGKMIGFILPNQKSNDQLSNFSVTVDEVESISGLNFYHKLDDKMEDLLESQIGEFSFNTY